MSRPRALTITVEAKSDEHLRKLLELARVSRHSPSSLCSAFQTLPVTAALGMDGLDMKPADNVVILERFGNQEAPNLGIRAVA